MTPNPDRSARPARPPLDPAGSSTAPKPAEGSPVPALLNRAPFQVGFLGVLGGMVALAVVGVLSGLQQLLLVVAVALFLAIGLNRIVDWLVGRGLRRRYALPLVIASILLVVVLGAWAVAPLVADQTTKLFTALPGYLDSLRSNEQVAQIDARFGVIRTVSEALASGGWVNTLFGGLLGAGAALANMALSLVLTTVLTIYFLTSLPAIRRLIQQLAPASKRPRVAYLTNESFDRIGGYLTGMFLVVALWGLGSFVVMTLAGLAHVALALCILVAALAFIPVVGWMFAAAVVALIAFAVSPTAGVVLLIYFVAYSQVDAYIVQPRIFSASLNVPPVLIVLGVLSGGLLLGVPGALLAIPTVAALLLLYREVVVPYLDAR